MGFLIEPPLLPMLAKRIGEIPSEEVWSFEPKWDGFRAIIFRDGDDLMIQSRDGKPLDRYFPELREPLLSQLPERCILDGEVVIAKTHGLDFDSLSLRIHPAASRIKMLSSEIPASVVFFDLIAIGDQDLRAVRFSERRARLEEILRDAKPPIHITPATTDHATAQDWFTRFEGAGMDGVMAKKLDSIYAPDKRTMLKVKHERECDCVVAGFRWHKESKGKGQQPASEDSIGSLLLGLYDAEGKLQHVGVCASFTATKRKELVEFLAPYRINASEGHPWGGWAGEDADGSRMPGAKSRWTGTKDLSWVALRPELVAEVSYEHMQGDRFRHMAHFKRWRSDRTPASCTYEQLEVVPPQELMQIFPERKA